MKGLQFYIISQYFLPDINGDVIRLLNSIKALKRLGVNLTIITAFPHYPSGLIPPKYHGKLFVKETWNDIKIIRTFILPLPHKGFINRLLLYLSFTFSSTIAILLERNVDIIWAFSQKFFSYITGLASKLLHRSKVIVDITDIWPEAIVNTGYIKDCSFLFRLIKLFMCLLLKLADAITTLTEAMKNMLSSWGINQNKIFLVPNVIRLKSESTMNNKSQPVKKENFVVMYSGNLGSNYDFKTLLLAASKLRHYSDVDFVIRGEGEMEEYISKFIKINKLNNVKLDRKLLSERELVNYLKKADVFILPMKKCPYPDASFPIKFLDYFSLGKPIVCCAEGFLAKLIDKYKIGIVVPPEDPDKLINAILALKKDCNLTKRMAKNVKDVVRHFSPETLEKAFQEVLSVML
mgnify:CR=1 FL=1